MTTVAETSWFFDLDGTLLDSGPAHEAAFRLAITEVLPAALPAFSFPAAFGLSTRLAMSALSDDADVIDALVRRKQQLYRDYLHKRQVSLFPGAHQVLAELRRSGCTLYLTTGGSRDSVRLVLDVGGLAPFFSGILTSDDVPSDKPDPRFYEFACRHWGIEPSEAVVVEDSPHGVTSAVSAGLTTIHVHARRPLPGAIGARHLWQIPAFLPQKGGSGV